MLDWFGDIVVEAGPHGVINLVRHGVGRKCHNWDLRKMIFRLPAANSPTGFITVHHRHLNVTLRREDRAVSNIP